MLKSNNIDEDDPTQLALFERMLRDGIYYKRKKYVRSVKSPAMGRTQRTEFIQHIYRKKKVFNMIIGISLLSLHVTCLQTWLV
jgi:hypothetical protein